LFEKRQNRNCLLLFSKVSKLIPKIIGHPKKNYYIVKIHENTYSASTKKRHNLPKPMVGSVIVYENRIIGGKKRGNHAEVNAINSVKDKSL
jgi:deoxycytidylate deaminase